LDDSDLLSCGFDDFPTDSRVLFLALVGKGVGHARLLPLRGPEVPAMVSILDE
jgi:hypothetical protein